MEGKICGICKEWKLADEYHKHPRGLLGRHPECKLCHNAAKRRRRKENPPAPAEKRAQLLKARYGLTPDDFDALFASQDGRCAICLEVPARPCVDHNHETGQVRGILCHFCNIRLPAVEDEKYHIPAMAYLAAHAANDNQVTREEAA